jgi:tripartite ATP-independent transporter DctP family solute receptor
MARPITRGAFTASSAAAFASIAFVPQRASAAEFSYKWGHDIPLNHPMHVRLVEMSAAIKRETNGRLEIAVLGNNVVGNDPAMVQQVRSNAIQFISMQGLNFSGVVPVAMLDGVGFAFKTSEQAVRAFEGELGDYIRNDMASKGLHGLRPVFDIGFREITSGTKPIRTADDLAGFKIRTPPARIALDLFKTLGAAPTPVAFGEVYTSLQTHVVDGQETPYAVIASAHFYEVQKYLSVSNHMWTCFWNIANQDAWNALPADVRAVVERNMAKATRLAMGDIERSDRAVADKLRRTGLTFEQVDVASMRARLGPYYARWKAEFPAAWALLEKYTGRLA